MRVLHLFSNKRWTGPAEPAANLAAGLAAKGVDVTFACSAAGLRPPHRMGQEVQARGLPLWADLALPKHMNFVSVARDAAVLARRLKAGDFDLVHCHMPVDHATAGLARRMSRSTIPLVRTSYDGARLDRSLGNRFALGHWTDALCVASPAVRDDVVARGLLPQERVRVVDGAVDVARFRPNRDVGDARVGWGLERDHIVFGVIARMQPYRRFDVLFKAFAAVVAEAPNARLAVIGRGTREEEVVRKPIRQRGLSDSVVLAGYLQGDAYVAALAAMDALIFLMPGSDGTCRTVREALAMGVPVIAADRGILPWLVEHGRTGLVTRDSIAALTETLVAYARDANLRATLAAGAGEVGPKRFALERQVAETQAVYQSVL